MKLDAGNGDESGDGSYVKTSGAGAAYVVAGHGGKLSGGSLNHPAMFVSLNELGSMLIDVSSNRMDVLMLGTNSVRDRFTIRKQLPPQPTFDRFAQQGFKTRRTTLLSGDWPSLGAVAANSAAGGVLSTNGDWIFYTPPAGFTNSDSFAFGVSDTRGTNGTGSATVQVVADNAPTENVLVEELGDGSVRVRFSGIPGRTYSIQFSNEVNSPVWQTATTATANERGEFEFVDTPPPAATRIYRSAFP